MANPEILGESKANCSWCGACNACAVCLTSPALAAVGANSAALLTVAG